MQKNIADALLEVCHLLHQHAVEFLIVGGTAVSLHGYYRYSTNNAGEILNKPDLDIWYNPTPNNYFNLLNALQALGQNVTDFQNEKAPDPKRSFFKYELEKFNLDLLPSLKAKLRFRIAFEKRIIASLNGIELPYISYEDLIKDKTTDPRAKDLEDVKQLEIRRKGKTK